MSLPNPMFDPETTGQIPAVRPLDALDPRWPYADARDVPRSAEVRPALEELPPLAPGRLPAPELAPEWQRLAPPDAPPAFFPPRLRTWTLPNGRFVLVLDHLGAGDVEWRDAANELRDRVGAAAVLAYADEVDVHDADVLVDDVPASVAAEDEALLVRLRGMQTEKLAEYRRELDELREEAVLREAAYEGNRRDLDEVLERMARTRELARAHGYTAIVEALTLPDGDPEGDAEAAEAAA